MLRACGSSDVGCWSEVVAPQRFKMYYVYSSCNWGQNDLVALEGSVISQRDH